MADDNEKPRKPPLPPGMGGKPPLPAGSGNPPPPPSSAGGGAKPPLPGGMPPLPGKPGPSLPGMGSPSLPIPPSRQVPPAMPSNLPPLPGLGGGPKFTPKAPLSGGMPMNLPPLPSSAPGAAGFLPLPPTQGFAVSAPPAPMAPSASQPPAPPDDDKIKLEKKLADLEKKLSEEREKLLVASIKREEEAATAARVEVSIKELQDKLRRDRRDQEAEENKVKLEQRLHEMEQRLAQERETWMTTLRNQVQTRESQEKEVETHFAMRMQEMERRWLEEKAQWQKIVLAKDEEIRNLRSLAEKLKGADVELSKTVSQKQWLEQRVNDLTQERAEAVAKLQAASEREKDNIQLRADLQLSRQQLALMQEKLERDLSMLRQSAKDREERLLSDQERLQRDLAGVTERMAGEHEAHLRRVKAEAEADNVKYKEALERTTTDVQKLRGVAGALERQLAASRAQINDLQNARAGWEKAQERYKAEFIVLQRKWADREREIRAEAEARGQQMLEAEKARIKIVAQDEINQRVARAVEQLAKDKDADLRRAEAALRVDLERAMSERLVAYQADWDKARKEFEGEIERLHQELRRKETEWTQRVLGKETEAQKALTSSDEALSKLRAETAVRQQLERQRLELEKSLQDSREQTGRVQGELEEARRRADALEQARAELSRRQDELERLCTAQGAQVQNLQQLLEQARGELAREVHLARLYMKQKEDAESRLPPPPPSDLGSQP